MTHEEYVAYYTSQESPVKAYGTKYNNDTGQYEVEVCLVWACDVIDGAFRETIQYSVVMGKLGQRFRSSVSHLHLTEEEAIEDVNDMNLDKLQDDTYGECEDVFRYIVCNTLEKDPSSELVCNAVKALQEEIEKLIIEHIEEGK